jgi:UPF0716 protein FxsA
MWLLVVFVAVPLIEIALFIQVGGWLTLWPTLAIVVATALIGTALVRRQGLRVLAQAQRALEEMGDPLAPLLHGALILFAGALLLTPGFLTDAVGLALLVPGVRTALLAWGIRNRVHVHVFGARPAPGRPPADHIVDAEFQDVTPDDSRERLRGGGTPGRRGGPSPWSGDGRP